MFQWVETNEFESWANLISAASDLPKWIRRLVYATSPDTPCTFPSDEDVRHKGWDGFTSCQGSHMYIPTGPTGWEVSCRKDVDAKIKADFKTRTENPLELNPEDSTIVFVTPRVWRDKDDWAAKQKKDSLWADVRVYDARELKQWFEKAPTVAALFAKEIQKYPDGVEALEDFWLNSWLPSTSPTISQNLLFLKRENEVNALRGWLAMKPQSITISAPTQDEAIAFLAAVIDDSDEPIKENFFSRALLVKDEKTWERLSVIHAPHILIPQFALERKHLLQAKRHFVFQVAGMGFRGASIQLKELNFQALMSFIRTKDYPDNVARQAHMSQGNLQELRRLWSVVGPAPLPWWASPDNMGIAPLVLLGEWCDELFFDERRYKDVEIVEALFGQPYTEIEKRLVVWRAKEESLLERIGGIWRVRDQQYAWELLESLLTPSQLQTFLTYLKKVLSAIHPRYNLEPQERVYAPAYNILSPYSQELRRGLSTALALIGIKGEASHPMYSGSSPKHIAERCVEELIEQNESEHHFWGSIKDVVALLAEAGPEAFITEVEKQLQSQPAVFEELFVKEGSSLHVSYFELLRALEILAWDNTYFARVVQILGKLDELDPGGSVNPRPLSLLIDLFFPGKPQTMATWEVRNQTLISFLKSHPKSSIAFLETLFETILGHRVFEKESGGQFRKPENHETVHNGYASRDEVEMAYAEIKRLYLERIDNSPAMWKWLWWRFKWFASEERAKIMDTLEELMKNSFDSEKALLQDELRHYLHDYHKYNLKAEINSESIHRQPYLSEAELTRLTALYDALSPQSLLERHAWLFTYVPELPFHTFSTFSENEPKILNLRIQTLNEILPLGLPQLLDFSRRVKEPFSLGFALGRLNDLEYFSQDIFLKEIYINQDGATLSLLQGYIRSKEMQGGLEWLKPVISYAHQESWETEFIATLLHGALASKELWEYIELEESEAEVLYWTVEKDIPIFNEKDFLPCVKKLGDFKRYYSAIQDVGSRLLTKSQQVTPQLVFEVLSNPIKDAAIDQPQRDMLSYYIDGMLTFLEEKLPEIEELSKDSVIALEWFYFPFIKHNMLQKTYLIQRHVSENADFFMQLLCSLHPPDGEQALENLPIEAVYSAKMAKRIFSHWTIFPGIGHDGCFEVDIFTNWFSTVLKLSEQANRIQSTLIRLGHIFAYAPSNEDGSWPHIAVCQAIEDLKSETVVNVFSVETQNKRGVYTKSYYEGGEQEFQLAEQYRQAALHIETRYPYTAKALRQIADGYNFSGRREDIRRKEER